MSKRKAKVVVKKSSVKTSVNKPVSPKETVKVPSKSVSKMDMATEYLEEHPGLKRKDALKYFREVIGLTPAGSSTYWVLICKKLNYKKASKPAK